MGDWVGFQSFLINLFPSWQRREVKGILGKKRNRFFTSGEKSFYSLLNEIYKMGFINLLFYLYSNLYSFGYFFQSQKSGLLFTKPSLNEGLSAKQDLLPFLRYNQTTNTYNNPTANVKSENSSMSISVFGE